MSRWTYCNARPFKRISFVEFCKYVFKYVRVLNERSFVAVVTGRVANILIKTAKEGYEFIKSKRLIAFLSFFICSNEIQIVQIPLWADSWLCKPPKRFLFSLGLSKKNRLDKLCQKYEYDGSDQTDDWLQTAGCESQSNFYYLIPRQEGFAISAEISYRRAIMFVPLYAASVYRPCSTHANKDVK